MPGTRREFLTSAAAGAAALALPRAARSQGTRQVAAGFATYVTEPSLKPPTLTVATLENPSAGYLFATTLTGPGQRGPVIYDDHGNIVWFRPTSEVGWFPAPGLPGQAGCSPGGKGRSHRSARAAASDDRRLELPAGRAGPRRQRLQADVHEFLITPQGTA